MDPQEIQLPANSFSKYGYVFNGWNTKADGTGVAYQNEELVTLEDNTVLYAQWKDCIVLYFYPNGGEGEIVEIAVDEPQTVTIPVIDLKREGYVFVGWNAEPDGSARSYTTHIVLGDEDINLYAEWEKLVTISYDPNGGTGSVFTDEMQPSKGGKISENIFSRKGYLFVGWNTNVNGSGTSYAELEKVTTEINSLKWKTKGEAMQSVAEKKNKVQSLAAEFRKYPNGEAVINKIKSQVR